MAGGGEAEADAGAADLAEDGGRAGNLGHAGGLAEAHFANALTKMNIAGDRAHPAYGSGGELAQRHRLG